MFNEWIKTLKAAGLARSAFWLSPIPAFVAGLDWLPRLPDWAAGMCLAGIIALYITACFDYAVYRVFVCDQEGS